MKAPRYTMLKGSLLILLATALLSGIPWASWLGYHVYLKWRAQDPASRIVAIVQRSPEKGVLKSSYLAELLDLSYDKPTSLYELNAKEAEKKLLHSPLIKAAKVRKIHPGTLYIDYQARKPIAFLGDMTNTAIDEEGMLFPFKPFFTPKKLPLILLGCCQKEGKTPVRWGCQLGERPGKLALKLLKLVNQAISDEGFKLLALDLSRLDSPSYGQREIVIVLENQIPSAENSAQYLRSRPIYLRFNEENFLQGFGNFKELVRHLKTNAKPLPHVVDFRVPHYAYTQ